MPSERSRRSVGEWSGREIRPGESCDVELAIGESYSGVTIGTPIHIHRAIDPGPVVFVTGALHGDEINGTGAVRRLIQDKKFRLQRGSLILVPVLNLPAFERHSRYLPDRRDLNRCFPGSATGSLAGRMAHAIFDEIVSRCDYGIDLHTAAVRRTNYPNVRADMKNREVQLLAKAFGCGIIINKKGPKGGFRPEACRAGCPTIVMEGGEVWKVESAIVKAAIRGVKNVLRKLDMLEGDDYRPEYQVVIERTKWIRADRGGFLRLHVAPGEIVERGQLLATNADLLGHETNTLTCPFNGIVIGSTTMPSVSPGEPVCHIGKLPRGTRLDVLRGARRPKTG